MALTQSILAPDASSPAIERSDHIGALDGVRGLAILFVILYHLANSVGGEFAYYGEWHRAIRLGWIGVTLFFVLSGYLITGILLDSQGRPDYLKRFYIRRTLRIFPLYFLALIVAGCMKLLWPGLGVYGDASQAWLWVYLGNMVMALKAGASFGFLDHFWSLSIEEQFYLVWPFVVLAMARRGLLRLALWGCVFALALRMVLVMRGMAPDSIYVFTPTRVDGLLAGAALAIVWRSSFSKESLARMAWAGLCISGAAVLAIVLRAGSVDSDTRVMQTVGHTLIVVMGAALIVLAQRSPAAGSLLGTAFLRMLGRYSYGLYVWHAMVFILVFHSEAGRLLRLALGLDTPFGATALAVATATALTAASWRFVEAPMLALKKRF